MLGEYGKRAISGIGVGIALSAAAGTGVAAPAGGAPPRLPLPTGRVTYSVNHALMKGTSTVTWAESGKRFRQEAKLRVQQPGQNGPVPTDVKSIVLSDGKFLYMNNSQQGKVFQRMPLKGGKLPTMAGSIPLTVDPKQTKLVGKGTFLGKPCEIREASRLRMWSWQGLPLKMEPAPGNSGPGTFSAILNSLRVQATKLEPGVKASPALFKVPAGYKIVDAQMPSAAPTARRK